MADKKGPVGFVGLGNMGMPMASRLVTSGWSIHVHDHVPAAVAHLESLGAVGVPRLAELATSCELIGIMVWDDLQLLELCLGDEGLVRACTAGQLLVIHSSVAPATIRRIATEADAGGVRLIDAPVSGGTAGRAGTGELAIMVGGADDDVARARPVLDTLARKVYHVGTLGSGSIAKIANNTMAIGNLLFVMEALRFAMDQGLDPERLLEIASESSGRSYSADNVRAALELLRTKRRNGNPMLYEAFHKDLFLTVTTAREHRVNLPLTSMAAASAGKIIQACEQVVADELLGKSS